MADQPQDWDPGLFASDTVEFDRALHRLRSSSPANISAQPGRVINLVTQLKGQPAITRREFDRRLRLIFAEIIFDDSTTLQAIADQFRELAPEALNALRTLLPADLRHLALPSRSPQPLTTTKTEPADSIILSSQRRDDNDLAQEGTDAFAAVALIGTQDEHVRNEGMLKNANLTPLRCGSMDDLWALATTGLCGFVVAPSVWNNLDEAAQSGAIDRICRYSTFMFVRIGLDRLLPAVASTFMERAADARCGSLDSKKFCHGKDCDLTPADIGTLRSIAGQLGAAEGTNFYPLGLSEADARLLRLIASERRHPSKAVDVHRLGTRELTGGKSGARVYILNDKSAQPFVVKIQSAEAKKLTGELRRYQRWILNWETSVTSPKFHVHRDGAAISYRLQPAADGDGVPAPTLVDELERLCATEWFADQDTHDAFANDLFTAISRAVDQLAKLNRTVVTGEAADAFWLHWPIRDLALRGIEFVVQDQNWEPITVSKLVEEAVARLEPSFARAVVHGDVHGRNILLIDRIPAFIDFAWSGPGHPLVDLVRLDAAVRCSCMRMLIHKRTLVDVLSAVYVQGADAQSILDDNAALANSAVASLAIRTAAKVREASLIVAQVHGLNLNDFLAMTSVVSAHVLANHSVTSGIERALLATVGSAFIKSSL